MLMRESASDIDFNGVGLVLGGLRFTYLTPWAALVGILALTIGNSWSARAVPDAAQHLLTPP